jgi:hypothetical protein
MESRWLKKVPLALLWRSSLEGGKVPLESDCPGQEPQLVVTIGASPYQSGHTREMPSTVERSETVMRLSGERTQ